MPLSQIFCRGGFRGQAREPSSSNLNPSQWGLWVRQWQAVSSVWYGTASGRRGNAPIYTFISYSHLRFWVPSSVAACSAQGHRLTEEGWNNTDVRKLFFKNPQKNPETTTKHTTQEQPLFLCCCSCRSYSPRGDKITSARPLQSSGSPWLLTKSCPKLNHKAFSSFLLEFISAVSTELNSSPFKI